jgi:competence protein ComEC
MPIFKRSLISLVASLWLIGGAGLLWLWQQPATTKVIFCDVGQGDATLLMVGYNQILIDGGPDETVLSCLKQHLPPGDQVLEMVVLSHPDRDHLFGLKAVFSTFKVKNILISPVPGDSQDWQDLYELIWLQHAQSGLAMIQPTRAQKWCIGTALCCQTISEPPTFQAEKIWQQKATIIKLSSLLTENLLKSYDYNAGSIVIKCEIEDKSILLTGDINQSVELALMRSGLLTKVDLLKIAHHGSKTSSNPYFLQFLQPEDSVIMCGRENAYGHPHQITLDNLQSVGSRIWRTDIHGEIVFWRTKDGSWQTKTQH